MGKLAAIVILCVFGFAGYAMIFSPAKPANTETGLTCSELRQQYSTSVDMNGVPTMISPQDAEQMMIDQGC